MAETALPRGTMPPANPVSRTWRRFSPRIVPVLAVLSAMILTIPFMVVTGGKGDIGRGLNIAFTAYSAFIEGALGIAVNNLLTPDDVAAVTEFAENDPITNRDLRLLARSVTRLTELGAENVARYAAVIDKYSEQLDAAALDELGERIEGIQEVGPETLRAMEPLVNDLVALGSSGAAAVFRTYGPMDSLTDEDVAAIVAQVPAAANYSLGDLLANLSLINQRGSAVTMQRMLEQLVVMDSLGIDPMGGEADDMERTVNDFIASIRSL